MSGAAHRSPAPGSTLMTGALPKVLDRLRAQLERIPAPEVPVTAPWSLGLPAVVLSSAAVPQAAWAVSALSRFGELSLSPTHLGVDGTDIAWADVVEVRMGDVAQLLSGTALDKEIGRIASRLPPVPGRAWLVRHVSQVVLGLGIGVAQAALGRFRTAAGTQERDPGAGIPMTVLSRGRFGRQVETDLGLFAALVCAAVPGVTDAVLDSAHRHGVTVLPAETARTWRNAEAVRSALLSLEHRLRGASATDQDGRVLPAAAPVHAPPSF